ncbi:MAG: hypothetical protein KDD62_02870, partial [Bdellovibrionales bacterium]|nr:hypothetical protein [Bdellovibrionales bacterium]
MKTLGAETMQGEGQQEHNAMQGQLVPGVRINPKAMTPAAQKVLSKEVLQLVCELHRELDQDRMKLLAERGIRQERFDQG